MSNGVWWVMENAELRVLLVRAAKGEDIDMLLLELYCNSERKGADDE